MVLKPIYAILDIGKHFGFVQVCVSQLMGNAPFGSSLQRGNLPRPFLQGLGTLGMLRRIVEKEGQESKVSKVWNGEVMTGLVGVGTFPVGFGTLYTGLGYNIARGSWTATGWNSWRKHGFLRRNTACSSEALCINPAIQNTILASWFAFDCLGLDAISHFQDGNIWKDGGYALGDGPRKFANVKM